ncbi:MAG: DUF667 domain-containing protein [archaeon]|nr:DUF667 domain-containing protein [archaeon]
MKKWKISGRNSRDYDSKVKTYVQTLAQEGTSKMQTPSNEKNSLGLIQSFLLFQINIESLKIFTIEIAITDTSNIKHRLFFSSFSKEFSNKDQHCRIPLNNLPTKVWINLSIDMLSIISECFKAQTFKSIDFICLTATCQIRKIYGMRRNLEEILSEGDETVLPKGLLVPKGVECKNILIDAEIIKVKTPTEGKTKRVSNGVPISAQGIRSNHYNLGLSGGSPKGSKINSIQSANNQLKIEGEKVHNIPNTASNKVRSNSSNKTKENKIVSQTMKTKDIKALKELERGGSPPKDLGDFIGTNTVKGKKVNKNWGQYDQNGRRINNKVGMNSPNNKAPTPNYIGIPHNNPIPVASKKSQGSKEKTPYVPKTTQGSSKTKRIMDKDNISKEPIDKSTEQHQTLLNTFNYKAFENESKILMENASIQEIEDFDCITNNNTIIKIDNDEANIRKDKFVDNNDNKNLMIDNIIKEVKVNEFNKKAEPIKNEKEKIIEDIFEGGDDLLQSVNMEISPTGRPYTPPISKMIPVNEESNETTTNPSNLSKINESIIQNHYGEMVYDPKTGKYYNSKTNVYYDFK